MVCALAAAVIPLVERSAGYTSSSYCFDVESGKWGLNVLVYGVWHFASLLFYSRWDREPGERSTVGEALMSAFATLGILMVLMAIGKTFIAPHFVDVQHGARNINDWISHNCLGVKP